MRLDKIIVQILTLAIFCILSTYPSWSQEPNTISPNQTAEPFILKGKVVSLIGDVQFRNTQTVVWEDMYLGQEVLQSDVIRTGNNGLVAVEFTNGNFLSLKENSTITLRELAADPITRKYDMVFDVIEAKLKAEANDREHLQTFEVHTLTAVAGVRGTIFFINATPQFTDIFVERGIVSLSNDDFQSEREVQTGLAATSKADGEISEPAVPDPEKMQEFQGFLEPTMREYASPPDEEPSSQDTNENESESETEEKTETTPEESFYEEDYSDITNEFEDTKETFDDSQTEFLFDILASQEADKTDYISDPPDPTGSGSADSDSDGLINSTDTDDDNDFFLDTEEINAGTDPLKIDTDADGLTDWEEVRLQNTDPLDTDSDNDTITDVNDADPNYSAITDTRSVPRNYLYTKIDAIPGLRSEISSMLADSGSRQRDYIMDRISDAQLHKVLKDRSNNWVRAEEYIFRPTSNRIDLISLSTRTGSVVSSLHLATVFNTSLNDLTSQEIKDLPWTSYLSTTSPSYGATAPNYYPVTMAVKLEQSGNSIEEQRTLNAPSFGGPWMQTIASDQLKINGGAFTNFSIVNVINNNPANFDYNYGSLLEFEVFVVNNSTGALASGSYNYESLWSILRTNLSGGTSIPSGHHLEIRSFGTGPVIDVTYFPMDDLLWRGDANWTQELTW